jgi:MFS transporter, DHA1 family, inner membrane transport protein
MISKQGALFSRSEKILLATLAFTQFSHIVDFMILMPLGPQLMRMFAISPQQFGLLVSIYNFAAGLSGFLAAFFVDRYDRKSSLQFFYVGFAVSTVACALSTNYETLLVARALAGFFGGVLGSLVMSIVSDSFEPARRGSSMGIVMAAFAAASVFGVPFSLLLANQFSWHAPFVFIGITSLFVIVAGQVFLPPLRGHLREGVHRLNPVSVVIGIASNKNQVTALIFMFLLVVGQFSIIPFLSPSFVSNAGLPESNLPLIYMVGGIISIFSQPLIGRLSDIKGHKTVFTVAALLSIIPIYILTNLGPTHVVTLLAYVAVFFLLIGGRMVPAMAMITSTVSAQTRGSFMSIMSSIQQLASAFASYIAGLIVFTGTNGELVRYNWVGYIAIGSTLFAIVATKFIRNIEAK